MNSLERKRVISSALKEAEYDIVLQGKKLHLVRKSVPLDALTLDPTNQRIQYILDSEKIAPLDQSIDNRMWKEGYVKNLSHSIQLNGGLMEPLKITADGLVMEGNSRLVALRQVKMRMERERKEVPTGIINPQCEILPENICRADLLLLLAEFHVARKDPWDAYEQAETIYNLHHLEKLSVEKIAHHLRMEINTVNQKLLTYELMTEYLSKTKQKKQLDKWSYFEEVFKKPKLRSRLVPGSRNYEPKFKTELFAWIENNKLKGENIRKLEPILNVPEAKKILDKEGFAAANNYLENLRVPNEPELLVAIENFSRQIEKLSKGKLESLATAKGKVSSYIDSLSVLEAKVELVKKALMSMSGEDEVASG